ncbi:MAG TPA: nucleoside-diphosphate sugar epimerase [Arenimonas sp.]|nr:nucleoside-diphosphate sugar epimerase [Arenimonas sp.]
MNRILIFGLSGQVGDALLPLLLDQSFAVTAISRQPRASEKNIIWKQAGFSNFESPEKIYDAIISLGPLDAFASWLTSSGFAAKKIIALSSTSIVTKKNSPDANERKLSELLESSEQLLITHAIKTESALVVLRPTLIYGNGRDQSLSRWLNLAKRSKWVVLPKNAGGLRQPVHVADVAAAVFQALVRVNSACVVLDLPGGEILAFDQMLLRTLEVRMPYAKVLRIPDFLFRLMLRLVSHTRFGRGLGSGFFARLGEDWVFDPIPARMMLAYVPRAFSP